MLARALDLLAPPGPDLPALRGAIDEVVLGYGDGSIEVRSSLASEPTATARDALVAVSALALSPRFLLLGGRDGTLLLYRRSVDPLTKKRLLSAPTKLERHDAEVTAAWVDPSQRSPRA